jgi:TPR repeat protein
MRFVRSVMLASVVVGCAEPRPIHVDAPLMAAAAPRPVGCTAAGIEVVERGQPSTDPSKQLSALRLMCARRDARSCLAVGEMELAGCGSEPSEAAAAKSFDRGCDYGDDVACGELGILLCEPSRSSKSRERATKLLTKGCKAGDAAACRELEALTGRMLERRRERNAAAR